MFTDDERGTLGHIAAQGELASTVDRWTVQAQVSWLARLLLESADRQLKAAPEPQINASIVPDSDPKQQ